MHAIGGLGVGGAAEAIRPFLLFGQLGHAHHLACGVTCQAHIVGQDFVEVLQAHLDRGALSLGQPRRPIQFEAHEACAL